MQVVIHAGAAFTDGGELQASLLANKPLLGRQGIAVFEPRRCRQFRQGNVGRDGSGGLQYRTPKVL